VRWKDSEVVGAGTEREFYRSSGSHCGVYSLFLAKVIAPVVCSIKHESLTGKALLLIKPLSSLEGGGGAGGGGAAGSGTGGKEYNLAVDCVGAGPGDVVIAGGPPGLGASYGLDRAPISTWVMAIVDREEDTNQYMTKSQPQHTVK